MEVQYRLAAYNNSIRRFSRNATSPEQPSTHILYANALESESFADGAYHVPVEPVHAAADGRPHLGRGPRSLGLGLFVGLAWDMFVVTQVSRRFLPLHEFISAIAANDSLVNKRELAVLGLTRGHERLSACNIAMAVIAMISPRRLVEAHR